MPSYIGRFAPTPSGPLHFGSLVAAVAGFVDARAHQGQWLIRIEDIDLPRCSPGASDNILHTLEAYGLEWDGTVVYQSQRHNLYQAALAELANNNLLFNCHCSRSQLQLHALYPGHCRHQLVDSHSWHHTDPYKAASVRIKVPNMCISVNDLFMPVYQEALAAQTGDFVLRRKDGLYAYQLAVVVDDAQQGINHIIRGADLYTQTPRQIFLQQQLHLPQPVYGHIPLIVNETLQKLSKQNQAKPIPLQASSQYLAMALARLNHPLPKELCTAPVAYQLAHAITHWQRQKIPNTPYDPHPFVNK